MANFFSVTYYQTLKDVFCPLLGAKVGWGQQRGGGGSNSGGGPTVGASSTSKNRPSHHKYKSPKQFELKGSKSS